jgi:hypothetical protein
MWQGGLWAHKYDIYFGTSPTPPLLASDVSTGSPQDAIIETYALSSLAPGTTYYWRVVAKTMANQTANGPTWRFTTESNSLPPPPTVASISPSGGTGSGATPVTVSGANFSPSALVVIGGALATNVSVANSNTITANSPTHSAGIVDVIVVNSDGQTASVPGAYSYSEPSLLNQPSASSISPASGATTGGDTVIISGTNFLPGLSVSFGGSPQPVSCMPAAHQ